jgi:hypothetical protein
MHSATVLGSTSGTAGVDVGFDVVVRGGRASNGRGVNADQVAEPEKTTR